MGSFNADGTIDRWTATTSFTGGRSAHTAVAFRGHLYLLGGWDGSAYHNDVQVAALSSAGGIGTWTTQNSFSTARTGHTSVALNGYVYVMGGAPSSGVLNDVQATRVNANGTLGTWFSTTSLPVARRFHSSVTDGDRIYVIGGKDAASSGYGFNDVLKATQNANGTLGAWTSTTPLVTDLYGHSSNIYNGHVYTIGGISVNAGPLRDVMMASLNSNGTLGAWSPTTQLPKTSMYHTSTTYNGYLYVIGGEKSGDVYSADVLYAPIFPDGSLGAWTSTTPLPSGRRVHASEVRNGYIYVLGGDGKSNTNIPFDEVLVAPINHDGSLGNWQFVTSLPGARRFLSSAQYNGNLYVLGGGDTTAIHNDVLMTQLLPSGTVGSWTPTTPFTTARSSHASVALNGRSFVIGGIVAPNALSDVQSATINADGTLGTWTNTSSLPGPRNNLTTQTWENRVYAIGGTQGSVESTDVLIGTLNSSGLLNPWTATTSLPEARRCHASAVSNGHLYVLGGYVPPSSDATNSALVAPIDMNGGVGSWIQTSPFSSGRGCASSVAYNGYLYILGGNSIGDGSVEQRGVQVAQINSDGTLGTWKDTTPLPTYREQFASIARDGFVYVMGGGSNSLGRRNDVWAAPINGDGSLGAWSMTTSFPNPRQGHASLADNGHIYVIGGNTPTYLNDVQFATIRTPASRGSYSKLIDLGAPVTSIDSILVNGSTANQGTVSLQYRVAPTSGVFGATVDKGTIPLGTSVPLAEQNTRYIWLRFQLDDTQSAVISPDATNERDITDVSLAYTPDLCTGVTCAALDQCHSPGVCDPATGTCTNPAVTDGSACDDGDGCTSGETCTAGVCGTPTGTKTCTASDECHTAGACLPATGLCSNPVKSDNETCSTGACHSGVCTDLCVGVTCTAQDECHSSGTCDPHTGHCSNPGKADDVSCSIGACRSGVCTDLCVGVTCTAQDACHDVGVCDIHTGLCSNPVKPDTSTCGSGACRSGVCTDLCVGVTCTAQDECHDVGTCDPQTGQCSNPLRNDDTTCTEGVCRSGVCTNLCIGVACLPMDECHAAGTCDPQTGQCSNPAKSDNETCTTGACRGGVCVDLCADITCAAQDECHEIGSCDIHTGQCSNPLRPDTSTCSEGACRSGVCTNLCTGVTCETPDACHAAGTCEPTTGQCSGPTPLNTPACQGTTPKEKDPYGCSSAGLNGPLALVMALAWLRRRRAAIASGRSFVLPLSVFSILWFVGRPVLAEGQPVVAFLGVREASDEDRDEARALEAELVKLLQDDGRIEVRTPAILDHDLGLARRSVILSSRYPALQLAGVAEVVGSPHVLIVARPAGASSPQIRLTLLNAKTGVIEWNDGVPPARPLADSIHKLGSRLLELEGTTASSDGKPVTPAETASPPAIQLKHVPVQEAVEGTPIVINATVVGSGAFEATVYHRQRPEKTWLMATMAAGRTKGDVSAALIPRGAGEIEYFISVADPDLVHLGGSGSADEPHLIPVTSAGPHHILLAGVRLKSLFNASEGFARGAAFEAGVGWQFRPSVRFLVDLQGTPQRFFGIGPRVVWAPWRAQGVVRPILSGKVNALFGPETLLQAEGALGIEFEPISRLVLSAEVPAVVSLLSPTDYQRRFIFGSIGAAWRI